MVSGTLIWTIAPAFEATLAVIPSLWFHSDYRAFRIYCTCGHCATGEQSASAQRHQKDIQSLDILKQFLSCRALTRHYVRVIEGRNQGETMLVRKSGRELFAILEVTVIEDDLRTVIARGRHLRRQAHRLASP